MKKGEILFCRNQRTLASQHELVIPLNHKYMSNFKHPDDGSQLSQSGDTSHTMPHCKQADAVLLWYRNLLHVAMAQTLQFLSFLIFLAVIKYLSVGCCHSFLCVWISLVFFLFSMATLEKVMHKEKK